MFEHVVEFKVSHEFSPKWEALAVAMEMKIKSDLRTCEAVLPLVTEFAHELRKFANVRSVRFNFKGSLQGHYCQSNIYEEVKGAEHE